MYNIQAALGIEKSTQSYIEAGIQENVILSGIRIEKSINGNQFIEFSFKKANAGIATHTEWEPNKAATEEETNERCNKQYARLLQILLCFYTVEQLKEITPPNFEGFTDLINWVKNMLEKVDLDNNPIRVKFIYNDSDFISLPRYAKYTFIESMKIKPEDSQIRVLGIDKIKRSIKADKEEPVTFGTESSSDLPF